MKPPVAEVKTARLNEGLSEGLNEGLKSLTGDSEKTSFKSKRGFRNIGESTNKNR
jgi:hypothetical protein